MNTTSLHERDKEFSFFFEVMNSSDIWSIFKTFMYPNKITCSLQNYKNGDIASLHGYIGLIKERHENLLFTTNAIEYASKKGHLEVVKWLHKNRTAKKLKI